MADLDEVDAAVLLQRANDAIDAVAGIAVDSLDAPLLEAIDQEITGVHAGRTDALASRSANP